MTNYDAIVIGAGPNGLAAAIELARSGRSVCIYEASWTVGGGARSAELTLPGFIHDVCSAVYPLAAGSPFFSKLPLQNYGLEFVYPPASLAHSFDDGTAVVVHRSVEVTSESLGRDRSAYKQLFLPILERWNELAEDFLVPLHFPWHPLIAASFGLRAIRSAKGLVESIFTEEKRVLCWVDWQRTHSSPGIDSQPQVSAWWALSSPVPWRPRECYKAATVHLGTCVSPAVSTVEDVLLDVALRLFCIRFSARFGNWSSIAYSTHPEVIMPVRTLTSWSTHDSSVTWISLLGLRRCAT